MKSELKIEDGMPKEITLSTRPEIIEIDKLEIKQGLCFLNSYKVSMKYPEIEIIEGVIIYVDKQNNAKAMAHVWNRIGGKNIDVTSEKIWLKSHEYGETKEIKYFPVNSYFVEEFKNVDLFEFTSDTMLHVEAINDSISKSI